MGKEDMAVLEERIKNGERAEKERKTREMKKKIKKKGDGFLKDFRKFITKGNVLDLAVAVVIGSAFNAIVNGLVKFIINPVISVLTGGVSLDGWKTVLVEGTETKAEVAIFWGEWIMTIVNFLIIALCIFTAVRMINKATNVLRYKELEEEKAAAEKKKAEEEAKKLAEEAAAKAAAEEAARKEAALEQFYRNVERQTALLEEISKK